MGIKGGPEIEWISRRVAGVITFEQVVVLRAARDARLLQASVCITVCISENWLSLPAPPLRASLYYYPTHLT